jgi:hypothetical protein
MSWMGSGASGLIDWRVGRIGALCVRRLCLYWRGVAEDEDCGEESLRPSIGRECSPAEGGSLYSALSYQRCSRSWWPRWRSSSSVAGSGHPAADVDGDGGKWTRFAGAEEDTLLEVDVALYELPR